MKLSEVFTSLAYGELSQTVFGELIDGEVNEERYPALLSSVNLGLTALHKRFNLKEGKLLFPLSTVGSVYRLNATDLHKIERIYTAEGKELSVNDANDPLSCYTPRMDTIRVPVKIVNKDPSLPDEYKTSELMVVYRANHPILVPVRGLINPAVMEVDIPYSHLEALLYFVASRVHNPIGMVNEFNMGNNWAAKYEQECLRLEQYNLEVDETSFNEKLNVHGWV